MRILLDEDVPHPLRRDLVGYANEITAGMERARAVLVSGDAAIAAYLLDEPVEAVERLAGKPPASAQR